jgi:hypothetical protein
MREEPPFDRASREEAALWVLRARALIAVEAARDGNEDDVARRMTRPDRSARLLHRRLRTLCEDLDELLGRVAEAVRLNRVTAAAALLVDAVTIAGELASRLSVARRAKVGVVHPTAEGLDEAEVLRALVLIRGLDDEVHRTAQGGGDGDASLRAGALLTAIRTLAEVARSEVAAGPGGTTRHPDHRLVEASRPRREVTPG